MQERIIEEKRCVCGFVLSRITVTTHNDGRRSMDGYSAWLCPRCTPIKMEIGGSGSEKATADASIGCTDDTKHSEEP